MKPKRHVYARQTKGLKVYFLILLGGNLVINLTRGVVDEVSHATLAWRLFVPSEEKVSCEDDHREIIVLLNAL